jgi:hypothetical protein
MTPVKTRGNRPLRSGSINAAPLIVVAAVLAGVAIAVVVAVRAAGPGSNQPAADETVPGGSPAANPLRSAQESSGTSPDKRTTGEAHADRSPAAPASGGKASAELPPPAAAGKHPLDPAVAMAQKVLDYLRKHVKDYTCIIVKQERLDGKLSDQEFMAAKIRQEPFSVYLKFLKPDADRGREVIYVAGANDGKLLVRDGSGLTRSFGMLSLDPTGPIAMQGNRYPILDLGLTHLTERLLEIAQQDRRYGEIEVHFFKDAKVNGRVCTLIEVVHPTQRRNFLFHKAQIYIDDELHVPIRYAAYMWPKQPGDDPPVDEVYTYLNLKLNVGLTDADFDPHNANYHFTGK